MFHNPLCSVLLLCTCGLGSHSHEILINQHINKGSDLPLYLSFSDFMGG